MDREKVKELLPIIQAYAEGKTIEVNLPETGGWQDDLNFDPFHHPGLQYRVKPETREWWVVMDRDGDFTRNFTDLKEARDNYAVYCKNGGWPPYELVHLIEVVDET